MDTELTTCKPLAPDDLVPGTHVAALFVYTEHLPFSVLCGDDEPWRSREVIRTRWLPTCDAGMPLRIVSVCLPFVLVERPDGKHATLDVRRIRLARLSEHFARKATKRLRGKNRDTAALDE